MRGRRRLAGQLAQRSGEIGPGQAEQRQEIGRQHAPTVEVIVDRGGDVPLVLTKAAEVPLPERRRQVQKHVVCAITQTGLEVRGRIGGQARKCAADALVGVQNCILPF